MAKRSGRKKSGARNGGGGGARRRRSPTARQKPRANERNGAGIEENRRSRWRQELMAVVLRPTYWFDPGDGEVADPYSLTISFTGRRLGAKGKPRPGDRFVQEQTVESIVPGSGPAAVTTEVRGINPGEWEVAAAPLARAGEGRSARPLSPVGPGKAANGRVLWPRRVRPGAGRTERLATEIRPLAPIPGVHQLIWGPLVILGVLFGLAVQALLLSRAGEDVGAGLLVAAAAVFAGWAGAKAWYFALQHGQRFDGWCVQGAIVGGAFAASIVLAGNSAISAGAYLDATAPALMLGMAVGRPGCFLAGCCYGRPTASRWGIWSSDRRLGIRRVPTQLIEAALCMAIGIVALVIALVSGLGDSGALLAGSLAAFVLGRQMILPYRAEPRQTSFGRPLTIAVAAGALIAAVLASVL